MPNMNPKRVPMPEQPADVRNKNFKEVSLGYTAEMAQEEAQRCLHCKNMPCVSGCPVNVNIPDFIECVKEGKFEEAFQVISKQSSLPAVCGRVCPQESQCEMRCVRGIKGESVAIGRLERFVADTHNANQTIEKKELKKTGKRVAVIGSGPSGLACAGDLSRAGHEVTIFESLHTAGGVLVYGIPEFRLPKTIVAKEIEGLKAMGVTVKTNMVVGKIISVDELFEDGFDAVFIGSGAGLPNFMNIPGEMYVGVYSANEYLTRVNLMKAYLQDSQTPIMKSERVAVVGGGNVAMDAARCAKRLGADVSIVYRRSMEEMPARKEEVHHAQEEGIAFCNLVNPVEVLGDENGKVRALKCVRMELGEPDESGRRRPVAVEGSEFELAVDTVIMAIGTSPNPLLKDTTAGLETNRRGCFVVDENMHTSHDAVWAGGDAVTGAATVISAMGAGKKAAAAICDYLK